MTTMNSPTTISQTSQKSTFSFKDYFKQTARIFLFPKSTIEHLRRNPIAVKNFMVLILLFGTFRFLGEYFYWFFFVVEGGTPNLIHPINFIAGWSQIAFYFLCGVQFAVIFLLDFLSTKFTKQKSQFRTLMTIFSYLLVIYSIVSVIDISLELCGIPTFFRYPQINIGGILINLSSIYITIGQICMAIILSYVTLVSVLVLYKNVLNAILSTLIVGIFFNFIMVSQIFIGDINDFFLLHTWSVVGSQFYWFSIWMLDNIYLILLLIPFYCIYLHEKKASIKTKFLPFPIADFALFLLIILIGYFIAGQHLKFTEILIMSSICFFICLNSALNRKYQNNNSRISHTEIHFLNFFIISLTLCLVALISLFAFIITLGLNLYLLLYFKSIYKKTDISPLPSFYHPPIKYLSIFFISTATITPFNMTTDFPFGMPTPLTLFFGTNLLIMLLVLTYLLKKWNKRSAYPWFI